MKFFEELTDEEAVGWDRDVASRFDLGIERLTLSNFYSQAHDGVNIDYCYKAISWGSIWVGVDYLASYQMAVWFPDEKRWRVYTRSFSSPALNQLVGEDAKRSPEQRSGL